MGAGHSTACTVSSGAGITRSQESVLDSHYKQLTQLQAAGDKRATELEHIKVNWLSHDRSEQRAENLLKLSHAESLELGKLRPEYVQLLNQHISGLRDLALDRPEEVVQEFECMSRQLHKAAKQIGSSSALTQAISVVHRSWLESEGERLMDEASEYIDAKKQNYAYLQDFDLASWHDSQCIASILLNKPGVDFKIFAHRQGSCQVTNPSPQPFSIIGAASTDSFAGLRMFDTDGTAISVDLRGIISMAVRLDHQGFGQHSFYLKLFISELLKAELVPQVQAMLKATQAFLGLRPLVEAS